MKNIKTFKDFVGGSTKTNEEAEGKMYKQKLQDTIANAQKFLELLGDEEDLEAWVQDKITISDHNMEAILGYAQSNKGDKTTPVQVQGDMATGSMLKDEK
jgi:hypothetical protein